MADSYMCVFKEFFTAEHHRKAVVILENITNTVSTHKDVSKALKIFVHCLFILEVKGQINPI